MVGDRAGDAHGDQWNDVDEDDAGCATVTVVGTRTPKQLATQFDAQGLLLLESAKWALPADRVASLKATIGIHYQTKLDEARAEGLVLKKRNHVLKDDETETLAGFNQRPGGRVGDPSGDVPIGFCHVLREDATSMPTLQKRSKTVFVSTSFAATRLHGLSTS